MCIFGKEPQIHGIEFSSHPLDLDNVYIYLINLFVNSLRKFFQTHYIVMNKMQTFLQTLNTNLSINIDK